MTQLGMMGAEVGAGALLGVYNDWRQENLQRKLTKQQTQASKELTDYNMMKQLEMWEKTNYAAQKEQMKKAGLNPGLMYGMGGGGGTTANVATGNASGGTAAGHSGEIQAMMGMGLQRELLEAQKEVMQSQAALNNAQAAKTAGVDTAKTQAETDNLLQGYDNLRNTYDLQQLEKSIKNLEVYEKTKTVDENIAAIRTAVVTAIKRLDIVSNEAKESDATLQDKIRIIKNTAIKTGLDNILTENNITKTQADIEKIWKEISAITQNQEREWAKMSFEERKVRVQEIMAGFNTDPNNKAIDQMLELLDEILEFKKPKANRPIY